MIVFSRRLKDAFNAFGRGAGLIGVGNTVWSGPAVLIAITLISLEAGIGATIGVLFGTGVSRLIHATRTEDWMHGLAGFNPGLVGLLWSGVLLDMQAPWMFLLALLLTVCLDGVLFRRYVHSQFHPLATSASISVWLSAAAFAEMGETFWGRVDLLPYGIPGLGLALCLILSVLFRRSFEGAILTVLCSAATCLITGFLFYRTPLGPSGLWGFTVAPAVFITHAVMLNSARPALVYSIGAGIGAGAIWILWTLAYTDDLITWPPLTLPAQIGIWGAVWMARRRFPPAVFNRSLVRAADALRTARHKNRSRFALAGAGLSTGAGIPDYVSGAFLDPTVPASDYEFSQFLSSKSARRNYWDAASRFLQAVKGTQPSKGHYALADLMQGGWIQACVTQNVDGLEVKSGCDPVIEVHGTISTVHCLRCRKKNDWPAEKSWHHRDLHCSHCNGLLKPSVIAMGENVPAPLWHKSEACIGKGGVILILGTRLAVSTAALLLEKARQADMQVILFNKGPISLPILEDDILVEGDLDDLLPALASSLGKGQGA